jgi:hypothetical protein
MSAGDVCVENLKWTKVTEEVILDKVAFILRPQ